MPAAGSVQMRVLGLRLKALGASNVAATGLGPGFGGGRTLRAQLLAGIRSAVAPMINEVRTSAREQLPKHGGLNESVATSKFAVRTQTLGPRAGVRITNTSHGGGGANRGVIRHPVFGRAKTPWVSQQDPAAAGWFDATLAHHAPQVSVAIRATMEVIAIEATRRL